jgi:hypothetical protein
MTTSSSRSRIFLGFRKLAPRYGVLVMPLLLSVVMTCIVSLVSTLRSVGLTADLLRIWLSAWALSWLVAFPTLLVVLPLVRRLTAAIVESAETPP